MIMAILSREQARNSASAVVRDSIATPIIKCGRWQDQAVPNCWPGFRFVRVLLRAVHRWCWETLAESRDGDVASVSEQ